MAQLTVYAKTNSMNWDAANGWNSQADGLGTDYTNPQNGGGNTYICDCNGKTGVVINLAVTVDQIKGTDATGYFSVVANITVTVSSNPGILYSGSNTSGFIRPSANKLTITHDQGAGTTAVSNTAGGYAIVTSGTGACDVSNSGGTSFSTSSTGRGLQHAGSGTGAVIGDWSMSNGGQTIRIAAGTLNLTGAPILVSGTTISMAAAPLVIVGGTANWTGSVTIGSGVYALIAQNGGTLNLTGLSVALTGQLTILYQTGTFNIDTGRVNQQTATAQCSVIGAANTNLIVGASIPSAADTRYGVTRGWPDGGTGATTGGGVAGGNGLIEMPNSSAPTGTQDATSDACVVSGKIYGSPQRTGSAAGGNGTLVPTFGGMLEMGV